MGLQETFKSAARTAFAVAGNVKVTATYHHTQFGAEFDTDTGTRLDTGADETIELLFFRDKRMQNVGEPVDPGDRVFLILQEDLTVADPDVDDYVMIGSRRWNVTGVTSDSASATWKVYVKSV